MIYRFTDRARMVMARANEQALRLGHEHIGAEHLLLGLAAEASGVGAEVLKALGVDLGTMRAEITHRIKAGTRAHGLGKLPQTPRAKKVIEYAIEEARAFGHGYVGTEHLLLGLLREQDGIAAQSLKSAGITIDAARAKVLEILRATRGPGRTTDGADDPSVAPGPDPGPHAPTFQRFTDRARTAMAYANHEAQSHGSEYLRPDHILLGVLREESTIGAALLKSLDVNLPQVRLLLRAALQTAPAHTPLEKAARMSEARDVIVHAMEEATSLGHDHIGTEHLLLGLLRTPDSVPSKVLAGYGVDLTKARAELQRMMGD